PRRSSDLRALQLFRRDVDDAVGRMLLGGIVDEDVQLAEGADRLFDRLTAKRGVADVAPEQKTPAAFLFHKPFRFFGVGLLVEKDDGHIGAFLGERDRYGAADAAVAARDDGGFAHQFARRLVYRRNRFGRRMHRRFQAGPAVLVLRGERSRPLGGGRLGGGHGASLLV